MKMTISSSPRARSNHNDDDDNNNRKLSLICVNTITCIYVCSLISNLAVVLILLAETGGFLLLLQALGALFPREPQPDLLEKATRSGLTDLSVGLASGPLRDVSTDESKHM